MLLLVCLILLMPLFINAQSPAFRLLTVPAANTTPIPGSNLGLPLHSLGLESLSTQELPWIFKSNALFFSVKLLEANLDKDYPLLKMHRENPDSSLESLSWEGEKEKNYLFHLIANSTVPEFEDERMICMCSMWQKGTKVLELQVCYPISMHPEWGQKSTQFFQNISILPEK